MAITKVASFNSVPTVVADYENQNKHIQAFMNQSNGYKCILKQAGTELPVIAQGSYIGLGGSLYVVDTEDYTVLGTFTGSEMNIGLIVSGSNLTATWVTYNSVDYTYNNTYNYYASASYVLLPYRINLSDTNYYISLLTPIFSQGLSPVNDVEFNTITTNELEITDYYSAGDYRFTEKSGEVYNSNDFFTSILLQYKVKHGGGITVSFVGWKDVAGSGDSTYTIFKNSTSVATGTLSITNLKINNNITGVEKGDIIKLGLKPGTGSVAYAKSFYLACSEYGIDTNAWGD